MCGSVIQSIDAIDARFPLPEGAGSDAMHTSPVYAMSLTHLKTEDAPTGVGLALALRRWQSTGVRSDKHVGAAPRRSIDRRSDGELWRRRARNGE